MNSSTTNYKDYKLQEPEFSQIAQNNSFEEKGASNYHEVAQNSNLGYKDYINYSNLKPNYLTHNTAVRGPTQEMFLKDLGCGIDTCQNLPITVKPVFNIIDSQGRLKFETNPLDSDRILGKAGYLAAEESGGLIRYDEYYSQDSDNFAYTNGKYPNQFGACQLEEYGSYRYEFVRTLGYAFTAVTVPENLPIYSTFGYDDGLPEPSSTFTTTPIWTILLKNSKNGTQGVGSAYLPWTPPVQASPIAPTNVCLLNGNGSILSRCGDVDRVVQFYDQEHVYFGFFDSIYGTVGTFIYSYIGYAFRSIGNECGLELEPIRKLYKESVGFTVFAGDHYPDLTSQGYTPTGKIIGFTIPCDSAPNGEIVIEIPGSGSTTPSSMATPTPTSISTIGFYVEPIRIVSESGGSQGYWLDPTGTTPSGLDILETSNVCVFTANSTVMPRCGYARNLYLYYDLEEKFWFVSLYTFGRNVTGKVIGVAFETKENSCGLELVPIRELFKDGVGYRVIAGDDTYSILLNQGFNTTGNIVGYTVDCKNSRGDFVYGELPSYEFSTIPASTSSGSTAYTPDPTDLIYLFVSPLQNVSRISDGILGTGFIQDSNMDTHNPIPVCIFPSNETFLPFCGSTVPLYQYFDLDEKFYFIGVEDFGRRVSYTRIGTAFSSEDNICGLKLRPMRELFKRNVGYTIVAGNNYAHLISQGYTLTGNILGYTVRCKVPEDKLICGNLPTNWTTTTRTTTLATTQKPTTTPYDLKAPLPKLDCDTIKNFGDLRWRMVEFSRYMEVGDNFTMTGHIWNNATESSLNMYVGLTPKWLESKISIHVNMRWWRTDIIYNYFWGKWDYRYETFSTRPFSKGMPYTLSIVRGTDHYLVYGNGVLIKKYWIVGDIRLHQVGGFMGFREWTIDTVQMDCVQPAITTVTPTSTTTVTTPTTTVPTTTRTTVTSPTATVTTPTTTVTTPTTSVPVTSTKTTVPTTTATVTTTSTTTVASTTTVPDTSTASRTTVPPTTTKTTVTTSTTTVPTTTTTVTRTPITTTSYNLSAPLPTLECDTIVKCVTVRNEGEVGQGAQWNGQVAAWNGQVAKWNGQIARWDGQGAGGVGQVAGDVGQAAGEKGQVAGWNGQVTKPNHIEHQNLTNDFSRSNVNFYLGFNPKFGTSKIPVHISQRWSSTQNIYNNYWDTWGPEAYSSRVFTRGNPFVLSVVKTSNAHHIYGNGVLLIKFGYRGTAAQNTIGSLIVYNDWSVDSIQM
ncbi:unnamed protein product [Caenorhabditis brenneri]